MKVIILAAGFGTRLERDIRADTSGKYDHLLGVPKPLVPIGKYPLITHWMPILQDVPQVDGIYVMTNGLYHDQFEKWGKDWPDVKFACDGKMTNEERIGAVPCINFCVDHFNIDDDMLVIAGDTLFYEHFSLPELMIKFTMYKSQEEDGSLLVYIPCADEEVHKYGILETDEDMRVRAFLEKPHPDDTPARKQCPCFYLLNKATIPVLKQFLEDHKDLQLSSKDAPGNFIKYLIKRKPVFAAQIDGRFDVGGLATYIECHEYFLEKHSNQTKDQSPQ